MRLHNLRKLFALFLVFTLLLGNGVFAEEKIGLFDKLKTKASQKIQDLKSKEWWTVKAGGNVAGWLVSKPLGLVGMGVGMLLGTCVAGPVGAAAGSLIGARFASTMGRTFVQPLGERVASNKYHGRAADIKNAWRDLDKKSLLVEGVANTAGSLIGEALGAAAGVALFAGVGPIAIPIMGVISGAVLGKKLGTLIGKGLGSLVARKAAVSGYKALTARPPTASGTAAISASSASSGSKQTVALKNKYEATYKAYIAAQNDPAMTPAKRNQLLDEYRRAFAAYKKAELAVK